MAVEFTIRLVAEGATDGGTTCIMVHSKKESSTELNTASQAIAIARCVQQDPCHCKARACWRNCFELAGVRCEISPRKPSIRTDSWRLELAYLEVGIQWIPASI
jgi:hypothetical protein